MTPPPSRPARTAGAKDPPPSPPRARWHALEQWLARLSEEAARRPGAALLLLLTICFACYLPGLFDIPPIDRTEVRYAQVARQMAETGDYVTPRFQHQPAFERPIGLYWLQSAVARMIGPSGFGEIWTYRLPSVLGAIGGVLITWWAAGRLFGRRVAFVAAVLLAANIILVVQAHLALESATLFALAAIVQWSLGALYLNARPAAERWLAAAFWSALGVSFVVGALFVPLLSGATIAALALLDRRAGWLGRTHPLWGLPLLVMCASPWLAAMWLTPETGKLAAFWKTNYLTLLSGPQRMNLIALPGLFTLFLVVGYLPAFMHLPATVRFGWRHREQAGVRFLVAWIVPYLLALELFSGKPPLYTVQVLYPPLAVLTVLALGAGSVAADSHQPSRARGGHLIVVTAFFLALVLLALVLLRYVKDPLSPATWLVAAAALAALGAAVTAKWRGLWRSSVAFGVGTVALLSIGLLQLVVPNVAGPWTSVRMAEAARTLRQCTPGRALIVGYVEPSAVFLLGQDTWRLAKAHARSQSLDVWRRPDIALAFVEARALGDFRASFAEAGRPVPEKIGCISGLRSMRTERVSISIHTRAPREEWGACPLPIRFDCP